jgi:hypothetical protein
MSGTPSLAARIRRPGNGCSGRTFTFRWPSRRAARSLPDTELGVISRRFSSTSFAGCKVCSDDVLRNGASTRFVGAATQAIALSELVRQYVQGIRFIHLQPLTEEQVVKAIVAYLNVAVATSHELMQYIDLHFYVLRIEVMSAMRELAGQAVKERNPHAERISLRWQVLQESRRLVEQGTWDPTLAQLRAAGSIT